MQQDNTSPVLFSVFYIVIKLSCLIDNNIQELDTFHSHNLTSVEPFRRYGTARIINF